MKSPFPTDVWMQKMQVRTSNPAIVHHATLFIRTLPEGRVLKDGRPVVADGAGPQHADRTERRQRAAAGQRSRHPARLVRARPRMGSVRRRRRAAAAEGRVHRDQHALSAVGQARKGTRAVRHLVLEGARCTTRCRTSRRSIAARRWWRTRPLPSDRIPNIPPGVENWKISNFKIFPEPATLYALSPHMHLRGKDMKFIVTYPDGREELVLDVPKYDFNWQLYYELATPLKIPGRQQADGDRALRQLAEEQVESRRPTRKCSGPSRAGTRCTTRRSGGRGICRI